MQVLIKKTFKLQSKRQEGCAFLMGLEVKHIRKTEVDENPASAFMIQNYGSTSIFFRDSFYT